MSPLSSYINFYSLVYISALLQHKEFLLVLSATLTTRKGKACLSAPLSFSLSLPPPPQPDSCSLPLSHFPLPDLWLQTLSICFPWFVLFYPAFSCPLALVAVFYWFRVLWTPLKVRLLPLPPPPTFSPYRRLCLPPNVKSTKSNFLRNLSEQYLLKTTGQITMHIHQVISVIILAFQT